MGLFLDIYLGIITMKKTILFIFLGLSFLQTACSTSANEGIELILSSSKPPVGVVFEIASGDDNGFKWAVPKVESYAKQLRNKFPEIKLAVVSHGSEQFSLTKGNRKQYSDTHKKVASLVKDKGIEVHVCGNFAAGFGVSKNDFVDYITVADRAPGQIKDYEDAGYVVLFVSKPAVK